MTQCKYPVIFHPKAEEEYFQSVVWYEEQLTGSGDRFDKEVDFVLNKLNSHPQFYS